MINVFNEIFTYLKSAISPVQCSAVHTNSPSVYPVVSLEEIDNSVYEPTSDSCDVENHAQIDFEVNIYTNGNTKKSEGDKIAEQVDTLFKSYGFVRRTKNAFQSDDEAIYRIILRYNGVVSKNHVVYRR